MMGFVRKIGMLKSRFIYDYKPFIQWKMKRFYSGFIRPGDLCFDLGSHTGNRSAAWLRIGARVVALEPQSFFAALIVKKLGSNENLTLLQQAVAEKTGKETLYISSLHPAVSTLSKDWVEVIKDFDPSTKFDTMEEISVITLDTLILKYGIPKFIKIDVEGYEEKVLRGLFEAVPSLSFEFFPTTPERAITCIDLLEELSSYTYNWSLIETFKFRSLAWLSAGRMKERIRNYQGKKSGDIYALMNKPQK